MKKLRISFNNKVYDVQVEVLEDDESHYPGAPQPYPGAGPTPTGKRPAAATSAPAPAPAAVSSQVLAPIVGTVTKVLVEVGAQVRENQPLIVLDAMKMDTNINAPRNGTITAIDCKVGESVKVGQKLLTLG